MQWISIFLFVLSFISQTHTHDSFSIVTCKLDLPKDASDYNYIFEKRAKSALETINTKSQEDIICLQGLALSLQDLTACMSSYMVASYANGCAVLLKKYTKSFFPKAQIPFLHGTYVALELQSDPKTIVYICSTDCQNKNPHKGCAHIHETAPIIYCGPQITQQHHAEKATAFHSSKQNSANAHFAIQYNKEDSKDFSVAVQEYNNLDPHKKITTCPMYQASIEWKKFKKIASSNPDFTPIISSIKIPIKQDPTTYDLANTHKKVYLPFGLPVKKATQNFLNIPEQEIIGKPLSIETGDRIRHLNSSEFSILYWHLSPQDSQKNKQAALEELSTSGADIVCLQGIDGIYLDVLYPHFILVKRTNSCAILTNKTSSLCGADAQEHIEINSISCKIYDTENPDSYIRIWNIELQPATLYNGPNIFEKYKHENTLITGSYIHHLKRMLHSLKTVTPHSVLGSNHDQICVLTKEHKIKMIAGSAQWEESQWNVFSGIGITTKYGQLVEQKLHYQPLYATFDWHGIRRYKNDFEKIDQLEKMLENIRIESGIYH